MLKQASVHDLKKGVVSVDQHHVVVTMRHYPRGLKKTLRSEYVQELSPADPLFKDFSHHKIDLKEDHNSAFENCRYEKRFGLTSQGLSELQRLAELSRSKDVYLVCQCAESERCHRELLLLMAAEWYAAQAAPLRFEYKAFEQRLKRRPPPNSHVDIAPSTHGRGLEWPIPMRD